MAIKPYLKWAGGKRQLLPAISRHIPATYQTYYEPFVGAGAVFFWLQPQQGVINDANSQLILTYRVIQSHVEELIALLERYRQNNSPEQYYAVRQMDRDPELFDTMTPVEKAARIIYLNKTCYNGLYRVNSQGLFNVPYGRYSNPAICEEETLRDISDYLNQNQIGILNGDFAQAVENATGEDFVYFDPPYHSPANTNFTGYQAGGFDEGQQIRLRDLFVRLSGQGTRCLLSNADTPFIRGLYADFSMEVVTATRAINTKGCGRGPVDELLVWNW